jgi:hypothetical protein
MDYYNSTVVTVELFGAISYVHVLHRVLLRLKPVADTYLTDRDSVAVFWELNFDYGKSSDTPLVMTDLNN